jgi:hypothetical protein
MPNTIIPYNDLLGDVHTSLLKDSEVVVCIWSSKFLKLF